MNIKNEHNKLTMDVIKPVVFIRLLFKAEVS
jgi:hypothetical protein